MANGKDYPTVGKLLHGVEDAFDLWRGCYDANADLIPNSINHPVFSMSEVVRAVHLLDSLDAFWSTSQEGWCVSAAFCHLNERALRMPAQ